MRTGAEHGGAFWDALGADFKHMTRRSSIINADVLDAWFPPSESVVEALREPAERLFTTSPPTDAEGLIEAISKTRGLSPDRLALGAGSSDLIFRAFLMLFDVSSKALVPDPTYSEYAHVLANVIGASVERLRLESEAVDLTEAVKRLNSAAYDIFVLVNPNSPTGHCHSPAEIGAFVECVPSSTLVWIDEAYADYAGTTCEGLTAAHPNVVVCKSMSKGYSLSGLRVGYLAAANSLIKRLLLRTPPWIVSLPGQVAACAALGDLDYCNQRWAETRVLATELADSLESISGSVYRGSANFVLWRLPEAVSALELVGACRAEGLYLRVAESIGFGLENALRVSVKDRPTQAGMIDIIRSRVA